MPLPIPNSDESKNNFVSRCMGTDEMKEEFSDRKQRVAVCYSQFSKSDKLSAALSDLAKAAAPSRYEPQEDEPNELIDCKSNAVIGAKNDLTECANEKSSSMRRLCIARASKKVCEASNRCSEKLGLTNHMLECHNYVERSVMILMKELSPEKIGQSMNDKSIAYSDPTRFDRKISVGSQDFMVDVATTPIKRKKGLMYIRSIEDNQGMLFEFGSMGKHGIWMKDTFIPLDVLWFDDNLKLVEFQTAVPCQTVDSECQEYVPSVDAAYVLEVPAGSFNGDIGDSLELGEKITMSSFKEVLNTVYAKESEYGIKYVFSNKKGAENLAKKIGCSGTQEFFNKDKKQSGLDEKTYYMPCTDRSTMHSKLSKFKKEQAALDPVGKEDEDINNDGKKDKTDDYLSNRRKKIKENMSKSNEEVEIMEALASVDPDSIEIVLAQVSKGVKESLAKKAENHNKKSKYKITTATLIAVFKRGVGAYKTNKKSVRPNVKGPEQWAHARVNAFLKAVKSGTFRSTPFDCDKIPVNSPAKKACNKKKDKKDTKKSKSKLEAALEKNFGQIDDQNEIVSGPTINPGGSGAAPGIHPCDCPIGDCFNGTAYSPLLSGPGVDICRARNLIMQAKCNACATNQEKQKCEAFMRQSYSYCKHAARSCDRAKKECDSSPRGSGRGAICACKSASCASQTIFNSVMSGSGCISDQAELTRRVRIIKQNERRDRQNCMDSMDRCRQMTL